jgi:tetratricopeptide (TPR) repeat protein
MAGLEMACALSWYWYRSGQFGLGARWLELFLAGATEKPSPPRARALHEQGWLVFLLGDWRAGHALFGESLYVARRSADRACECLALASLGTTERWLGNRPRGWEYALKAIEVARDFGDPNLLSRALIWAYATTGGAFVGKPPLRELEEAAALARETGNEWIHAHSYDGLGDLYRELGDYDRSREAYRMALSRFRRLEDRYLTGWTLEGLGLLEMRAGNTAEALRWTQEAVGRFDSVGDELTVAFMLARIVGIACGHTEPGGLALIAGAASTLLEQAGPRGLSHTPQMVEATQCLSDVDLDRDPGWLRGRAVTRAEAVAAAQDLRLDVI